MKLFGAFGNVVLEAMASGVPPIVTDEGGPKYIVRSGVNGYIAASPEEFAEYVLHLKSDAARRRKMAQAARKHALGYSWHSVFEGVYRRYAEAVGAEPLPARNDVRHNASQKLLPISLP